MARGVFSCQAVTAVGVARPCSRAIRDGGGNGSIIGRNAFQRERGEALEMLERIIDIYKGKA